MLGLPCSTIHVPNAISDLFKHETQIPGVWLSSSYPIFFLFGGKFDFQRSNWMSSPNPPYKRGWNLSMQNCMGKYVLSVLYCLLTDIRYTSFVGTGKNDRPCSKTLKPPVPGPVWSQVDTDTYVCLIGSRWIRRNPCCFFGSMCQCHQGCIFYV